jgi:hypothetical protein
MDLLADAKQRGVNLPLWRPKAALLRHYLRSNDDERAESIAKALQKIFGEGNFYNRVLQLHLLNRR